jgi:TPR repeat protein
VQEIESASAPARKLDDQDGIDFAPLSERDHLFPLGAIELRARRAIQSCCPCDSRLADNGYPIEGNRTAAMKWLLATAEQGLPRAQSILAEIDAERPCCFG